MIKCQELSQNDGKLLQYFSLSIQPQISKIDQIKCNFKNIQHLAHLCKNDDLVAFFFLLSQQLHHFVHLPTVINGKFFIRQTQFLSHLYKMKFIDVWLKSRFQGGVEKGGVGFLLVGIFRKNQRGTRGDYFGQGKEEFREKEVLG